MKSEPNRVGEQINNDLFSKLDVNPLLEIFKFLSIKDLDAINSVCKRFNSILKSEEFKKFYSQWWLETNVLQNSIKQQFFRVKERFPKKLITTDKEIDKVQKNASQLNPEKNEEIANEFTEQKIKEFKKLNPNKTVKNVQYFINIEPITDDARNAQAKASNSKFVKLRINATGVAIASYGLALIMFVFSITCKFVCSNVDGKKDLNTKFLLGFSAVNFFLGSLATAAACIGHSYVKKSEKTSSTLRSIDERSPLLIDENENLNSYNMSK